MKKIRDKLPWLTDIARIISITDPGKDPDDENTMVVLGNFTLQGAVTLLATVANLAPEKIRAQLTRVTYDLLGMRKIDTGVGTNCTQHITFNPNDYQWQAPYLRSAKNETNTKIEGGQKLLLKEFGKAKDKSITLLLISGMTDAAQFLFKNQSLFLKKIKEVVIMGGVKRDGGKILTNDYGLMEPDSAANNAFDMYSAEYLYETLQEKKVTMWILTREAAYAARFPRSIYDEMAKTGHPVGIRLKEMQNTSIQNLWTRANMSVNSKLRELPPRCDKNWFCNTFCGGQCKNLNGNDDIWKYIESFILYDPMTLIAAIPKYRNVYFTPVEIKVKGTVHYLIGLSKQVHGIKYPDALRGFIHSQIVEALDIFSQYIQKTGT